MSRPAAPEANSAVRGTAGSLSGLRHMVLFRFAQGASAHQVEEVVQGFARLAQQVPGVDAFEWGRNCSPEGLDRGFSHAFVLTFADEAARDRYLPHPAHQAFVQQLRDVVAEALVVDYLLPGH